jgi:hypothetical protein
MKMKANSMVFASYCFCCADNVVPPYPLAPHKDLAQPALQNQDEEPLAFSSAQAGPGRESERFVVPQKPGNAGGGKGPQFKTSVESGDSQEIGDEPITSD